MNSRYSWISLIFFISAALARGDMLWFIIWLAILMSLFLVFGHFTHQEKIDVAATIRRTKALQNVRIYLEPYQNIWRNLKVSNRYCSMQLGSDADLITFTEKKSPYRKSLVINSHVHPYEELWNMLCNKFNHRTTYKELVESCDTFKVSLREFLSEDLQQKQPPQEEYVTKNKIPIEVNVSKTTEQKPSPIYNKVDINNCSEMELTELPGINIIMAKKVVKQRDEINGFKSAEELYQFLNLKPHIQSQLADRILINKKKKIKAPKKYNERNVDI